MKRKYLLRISTVIIVLLCLFSQAQALVSTILELQSPSPSNDDKFGAAVSIDGDIAVVNADEPNNCGRLYVYRLNGLHWQYEAMLTAPNSVDGDFFGHSVCVAGDSIVASAHASDSWRGAVCVFEHEGAEWGEPNILTASDGNAGDLFGWSVDFDGNKIVVGAIEYDDQQGAAYVFSRDGSGWSEEQKLTASDGDGKADRGGTYGDYFGWSVAIDGNMVVVGARRDQLDGANNDFYGSVYVFKYSGGSWSEDSKLEASDGAYRDYLGVSVSVCNNTVAAGAYQRHSGGESDSGAVYVYEPNGASWDETILEDPNPRAYARLGYDAELDGDRIIAGAYYDSTNGLKAGAALLFERSGASWGEGEKLAGSVPVPYDKFGYSVAIDGNNVLVGAPYFYDTNAGKAYVIKLIEPVINEFRVNSYTSNNQQYPAVAMDANGNFIVVWESRYQDGDRYGVYGQRYDSYGRRIDDEFLVNVTTSGGQDSTDVAMNGRGDFVVVWEGEDGSDEGIYGRRYASDGQPLSGEFLINTYTDGRQLDPKVAMKDNGAFVITWDSCHGVNDWRIAGRVYDAAGNPLAPEFDINQSDSCHLGDVVMDDAGDFVVVWEGWYLDGQELRDIRMRRYYANGTPKADEVDLVGNKSSSLHPGIATDGGSNYVLTWHYHPDYLQRDIYAQRFDSNVNPVGSEFMVNTTTAGYQICPAIAMNNDGQFVIAWYGNTDGSGDGVFAQRYDSNAAPVGSEIQLNSYTSSTQERPAVAMRVSERFITAWHSDGEDGSGYGVYTAFGPKTFLGDFTGDGVVDWNDLAVFTSRWLRKEPVLDMTPSIIGDDAVNFLDFCTFAENWLVGVE